MKTTYAILLIMILVMTSFKPHTGNPVGTLPEGTILNLYDAFSKNSSLTRDFGFSCIINYQGRIILFDAGSNADIFKKNTTTLGVDLTKIDLVIVSHGHFDHLNGLDYLLSVNPDVKIYFPYDIFWGAPVPFDATGQEPQVKDSLPLYMQYFDGGNTRFTINQSGRFWNADIEYIKTSKEILPGLNLIATSSSFIGYFSCYPGKPFVEGAVEKQADACKNTNLPELSLSLKTDKGQVLIAGCSHTGIEHIVKSSQTFTQDNTELVYGGFHLIPFDRPQTMALVNKLKNELKVHRVAPAHCTGHLAFRLLKEVYGNDYLYAGLGETISY